MEPGTLDRHISWGGHGWVTSYICVNLWHQTHWGKIFLGLTAPCSQQKVSEWEGIASARSCHSTYVCSLFLNTEQFPRASLETIDARRHIWALCNQASLLPRHTQGPINGHQFQPAMAVTGIFKDLRSVATLQLYLPQYPCYSVYALEDLRNKQPWDIL